MKTLSKTASKTQHSEKIKPLRYRNLKRLSLNNFNRKKKKNPEGDQRKYKEKNFPKPNEEMGNSFKYYGKS